LYDGKNRAAQDARQKVGLSKMMKSSIILQHALTGRMTMGNIRSSLDHIVVIAASLEEGVQWCIDRLGVTAGSGGRHVSMGTHNRLLKLNSSLYLEIIAIDPAGQGPAMPRWFGMDSVTGRLLMAKGPRLAGFVIRTNDIDACVDAFPELGRVHTMQRGNLKWRITIPEDGNLVLDGALPTVIQWPEGVHPTSAMADAGCELASLEIIHPEAEAILKKWDALGFEDQCVRLRSMGSEHRLRASLRTPGGSRSIEGVNVMT
jgi:hypothetical protein